MFQDVHQINLTLKSLLDEAKTLNATLAQLAASVKKLVDCSTDEDEVVGIKVVPGVPKSD